MRKAKQSGPLDDFEGKLNTVDALDDDLEVEICDLNDVDRFEGFSQPHVGGPRGSALPRFFSPRQRGASEALLLRVGLTSKGRWWLGGLLAVATVLLIVVVIFPSLNHFLTLKLPIKTPVADPALSASFQPFSIETVAGGMVYAVGPDQTLHALNTADGTQLWQYPFPFYTANPQNTYVYADHGFAYLVLQQNQVQMAQESKVEVLRLSDARQLWRSDRQPPGSWPVLVDHGRIVSSSFFWVGDGISAVNVSDGSRLWQHSLGTNQGFNAIPLQDKLLVSITPTMGKPASLSMLKASDGSEIWHYANSRFSLLYLPSNPSNGLLYLGDSDGAVEALRVSDGSIVWQYTPRIPGLSTVAIKDGAIYVSTQLGGLDALNASDGSLLWHWNKTLATRMVQEVAGVVYAITTDGVIYSIRAKDGVQLWRFSTLPTAPETNVVAPNFNFVTAGNGIVYVAGPASSQLNAESTLYALRGSDGVLLWKRVVGGDFSLSGDYLFGGGSFFGLSSPLQVLHNTLYLNVEPDRPGAVRTSDGYVLWLASHPASGLQVIDDIVYSTSSRGVLNACRARDGALLWQYPR